jgi:hypothetical protein
MASAAHRCVAEHRLHITEVGCQIVRSFFFTAIPLAKI